jgi:hypothetical protein
VDSDKNFQRIYDRISDLIADSVIHEQVFEDIDLVLSVIWGTEGTVSATYSTLFTEGDKEMFIKDFQSAVDWLISWNRDDLSEAELASLAAMIVSERGQ